LLPTDPLFWLLAVAAVTCFGLAKGGFAGIGLAGTALLALAVPPLQAAAILLPILLLQDAISVWLFRREWDAWNLKVLLAGSIVGIGIAWALAAIVSDALVKIVLGAISVAFVLTQWLGLAKKAEASRPRAASGLFWGVISGFTSTLTHAGLPAMNIHLLPQRLPKLVYLGTVTIFFAAVNAVKVVPFFFLGQLTREVMLIAAALVPVAIVSNVAGVWLVKRVPEVLFYRIVFFLMFVLGLELIRQGMFSLSR
jgi:uncharacterized membrane protein YfcA